jgi:hypothetical protein
MASTPAALNSGVENVVRLSEYRKRRLVAQRPAPRQDSGAVYFCLRCDADEFKLQASGGVSCAHCGALMRNLFVQGTTAEESPLLPE